MPKVISYKSYKLRGGLVLGDKAIQQFIDQAVDQPVWDHPTEKNRQIGKVVKAERDDEHQAIKITMELNHGEVMIPLALKGHFKGISIRGTTNIESIPETEAKTHLDNIIDKYDPLFERLAKK